MKANTASEVFPKLLKETSQESFRYETECSQFIHLSAYSHSGATQPFTLLFRGITRFEDPTAA